jgi:hypothetical protein
MSEAKGPKPMPFSQYLNDHKGVYMTLLSIPQIQTSNVYKTPPDMTFSSVPVAIFTVENLIALVRAYEAYIDAFMSNPENV